MKSMRHLGSVCNSGNSYNFTATARAFLVVAILAPAAILIWDTAVAAEKVRPRLPDDSIIVSERVSPVLPKAELLALSRDFVILPSVLDGQTITVTTLDDISDFSGTRQVSDLPGPDGRISFREACIAANNTPGGQTIAFAIPVTEFWLLSDVALLKLEQGGFFLTDSATTVDFSTQTTNIGDTNPTGPEVGIYGLEPNGWGIAAIFMNGDNGVIKGLGKVYQRGYGVRIVGDNNRLIGCQISGPLHSAMSVEGYLGGPTPTGNTVGGTALGEGNYLTGLRVGGPADNNVVIGNTIIGGVDIIGSTQYGVIARNNRIGGPTAAHRNIISGAGYYGEEGYPVGEQLSIVDADGTVVQGNYIGTTVDGMARYPQQIGPIGVEVRDSRNTTIHDNLIAGLRTVGVNHYNGQIFGWAILVGATNRSNQGANIEANTIGLAADGVTPIVTRSGITVSPLSGNYHAYGTHIVYNHIAGVETNGIVIGSQENGIIITGNSIHDSGALGIDLFSGNFGGTGGVTLNDLGDADTGGNGLQNFPVLVSATTTGSSVTIQGTLDSSPSEQFTVEFFASPSCDASGYGEGTRFLGSTSVTTDGTGHGTFSVTAPTVVAVGALATATTKRAATGDTSEFSGCIPVVSTAATPTATPTSTPTSTPTATPTATPTQSPTPTPGMEGDVAPRPNGDGVTMATDVTQLRRFAAGLDTPDPASNEAQRADCAPRISLGDGLINAADVVQARRYAAGLDPSVPSNRSTAVPLLWFANTSALSDLFSTNFLGREIAVRSVKSATGSTVTVPVEITPFGDETAAGFTLVYDAAILTNPHVELGEAAPKGAILTVNYDTRGRIGIVIDSTEPMTASAMPKRIVMVTFGVAADASGDVTIKLTGSLAAISISDAAGKGLSVVTY